MKTFSTLLFAILLTTGSKAWADYTYENVPTGYGLAWSDEFNGAVGSLPNSANWSYDTGVNQPNSELENYTNSTNNIHVIADPNAIDGKSLAIIALDPGGNNDVMGNYTSARIDTADKKTFTYGYMEARVRMPYGQGIWPAFWMLGNDINHGVSWPQCDEIDIMENIGQTGDQGTNHMSLHDGNDTTYFPALPGGQLYHNAYHTFAALWQSNQIQFFVDGNLMVTDTPASLSNNWAFNNNPNFFLLNMAVGGNWPGNPDGSTSFPQTMYVDYVRAYQTGMATPTPVVQSTWRVRCGGDNYTDSQGNLWQADSNFTGGWPAANTGTVVSGALPASTDGTLYQWERYGNTTGGQTLTYTFNVPTGSNYQVTMKFAEDYWTAAGQRLFSYAINGTTEASNFDIFASAGGQFKALDKVYSNIVPNANGQIVITLSPGSADNPKVDAIQVVPMAGGITNTPTFTPTAMATNTPTATPTATTAVSGSHLPYQVVGYCFTGTKGSTTSLTGNSGNINWNNDVPWQDLTVAVDAFMIPNTNNTFSNGGAKNAALVAAAHAHGVRCIVSIGGGGQDGAFPTVCQAANRQNFASAVTALIAQYGYDGADIDWEAPNTAPQADATAMMQDIYTKIKAMPNSSLDGQPRTLSFATVDYVFGIYNLTTLGNYTDWLFYMGYDWYDCPNLYNGPLNLEKSGITSITNGSTASYPISKVVLGCPLYVNDYNTSNCTASEYSDMGILHLGTAGAYNSTYAEQAYTAPNGHTVYVDTAQSYCDKINWAMSAHLKGIGMWDVGLALPYTDGAVSGIWNTIGGQAGCLNLGPTATPTKTATPVVASSWRVNAGGNQYTDSQGNVWAADENFTGGTAAVTTSTITSALPTGAQTLYQSQRYGNPFSYSFNVPAGSYQVTLKFAETYWTAAAQRVFNVSINGTTVLTNFDIFKTTGAQNKAIDEVFNSIAPTGGVITINFGPASVDNAVVQAIQIIPQPATPTNTPTLTATKTNTPANTATSTMTATNSSTLTNSPTATSTFTNSPTATFTNSNTPANTSTFTFTGTPTNTPLDTATPTWTGTPTNTGVNTATNTVTSTATFSFTPTNTNTPVNTATNTNTAVFTATSTWTFSSTPTWTGTPTATWTGTSTFTSTPVRTSTFTPSFTPTPTWTGTPTATRTFTGTPTKTATPAGACAGIPMWSGNSVGYSIGAKVQYNGELYQCIQAHTSLSTWMPSVTPALWKDLGSCSGSAPKALVSQPAPVPYPNPATGSTTNIGFTSPINNNVSVQIYTVSMRLVKTVNYGQVNTGNVVVNLIDNSGVQLANGLYYFQVHANGQSWTVKVLVTR